MKFDRSSLTLYAITDSHWLNGRSLEHDVELAVRGGVTMIQVREKNLGFDDFVALAKRLRKITRKYNIPMLINDNPEVCLASDADGVHVGQHDMEADLLRKKLGPDKIIGVSAQSVEMARKAEAMGADYLGVGAVFGTSTKLDARPLDHRILRDICRSVSIPAVAIGGITENNICQLARTGIAGVAVVSAIFAQPDIEEAARILRRNSERMLADA